MDRLLVIEPQELILSYELGQKSHATVKLRNVMYTMHVGFKVQPTAPRRYAVKPSLGIIPPLGFASVEIALSPPTELPECAPYSEDKFLVKSVVVPGGGDNESVSLDWFSAKRKQVFSDHSLKIVFIGGGILRRLVVDGFMEDVREILELDETLVNSTDGEGRTPMHIAVECGRPEMVPLLLEFSPDVNVRSKLGQTALQEAASRGEALISELLLSRGAKPDLRNSAGWTALHKAVVKGHAEVSKLLVDWGADVNAVSDDGRSALHLAVDEGRHECLKMLLELGADTDIKGPGGETSLHRAATRGDRKASDLLLRYGASSKVRNFRGKTPGDVARASGQQALLLLDELSLGDDLRIASRKGKVEDVHLSLRKGGFLDGRDEHGWTALHRAAFKGHMTVVSALLEKGADIDSKDNAGYTPLHCATEAGHKSVVRLLLKHGAQVNAYSFRKSTALDIATAFKHFGIQDMLIDWGALNQKLEKHLDRGFSSNRKLENISTNKRDVKGLYDSKSLTYSPILESKKPAKPRAYVSDRVVLPLNPAIGAI